MRKAFKKLLASLLALAMVCALAAPVFADTTENLSNHKFTAYQIFRGDVATVGTDTKLSNAAWGADVDYNAILIDLGKSDFTTQFPGITTASSAADVVAKMTGMKETDAVTIAFAKMVATHLTGTGTPFTGTSFTAPEAGYYLIKDTTTFSSTDPDKYRTYQFSLLKVTQAGKVTITSKAAKPTVTIEVQKEGNTSWGKSTDAAIGDICKFRLTATLPESPNHNAYDYYDNYTIWFTNDLSAGFSEMSEPTIITDNGSSLNITDQDVHYTSTQNGFGLMIENLADHAANLNLGATVIVEFTAKLNSKAAITTKSGVNTTNTSTVQLSFSNDPAHSDSIMSGMGTTAKNTAYVHTYGIEINKVDADTNAPLKDAKFKLYWDSNYTGEMKFTKDSATGAYYYDAAGTVGSADLVSDANGKITINGLIPKSYYLDETEAPAGYNKVGAPLCLVFSATHDSTGASVTLTTGHDLKIDAATGLNATVKNKAGVVLPSTGGIGTTIFYVVGGLLMVGAAVLLVTKKRMENN